MPIPTSFNKDGVLDPGTYDATFADIRNSILIKGSAGAPETWDQSWRLQLLSMAEVLVNQLWQVGITEIFLDGSFVEDKDHPNDIDGYFDPNLSSLNQADMIKFAGLVSSLNNLDSNKVWNWDPRSRVYVPGFSKKQLPMWVFYRTEFYPHLGQGTGIQDQYGNDLKFPSAFRQSRNNFIPKGIVRVIK